MRARVAPSANRSEISLARATPRASSIPPMFVHAINRISATSMKSKVMKSAAAVRPGIGTGREGSTPMLRPRLASGYSRSRSRAMRATSSRAWASVTAGFRRPLATIQTGAREVRTVDRFRATSLASLPVARSVV
jgi:hypothetical protein